MKIPEINTSLQGFYADREALRLENFIVLKYLFMTKADPYETAAHLCQEQSTAQYKRVDIDEDFRVEFASKVLSLRKAEIEDLHCDANPFDIYGDIKNMWLVEIVYPWRNFGDRIPNLITAICGEGVFHSPNISQIKLLDISFPDSYLEKFDGPRFGIDGIRKELEVYDRPIIIGVIKPNIGLPPEPFGELAYQAWLGGLDVAKDDELLCDTNWSPFEKRTSILGRLRLKAEAETRSPKMYLANITDEVDKMPLLYDIAIKNHVNAVMINGMTTGLSVVRVLSKKAQLPLFSHFDFIAPFTKVPTFGVHLQVVNKLHRLAGYDCIIYQGLGDRMGTSKEEVLLAYKACVEPMGNLRPCLPVPAGSQWAGSLAELYSLFGSVDFGIVPGRAIFSHPMGPGAGAKALLQGWEAVLQKQPLDKYAVNHIEVEKAIQNERRSV